MLFRRALLVSTAFLGLPALAADPQPATGISEITITAERHASTVQETPISITALSGEQLAAQGISSVEEVAREVPGLSMRSAGPGQTEYEARGLASVGGSSPTVGFYLDDVPLSPPATAQNGKVVIDPDLFDLNRVEVLRGPQGTLYGSGSMGGTIRLVTNQPKLDTYEGAIQASVSGTDGGGANGGTNAMINLPIGDKLALRMVGTESDRSGWIDRIVVSPFPSDTTVRGNVAGAPVQKVEKNVNDETLSGARASLLFQATDDLAITASVLYQRIKQGGYDEFDSPPGGSGTLAHYEAYDIAEPISDTVKIYSLTATEDLGFAELSSSTAYWQREEKQTQDASESVAWTLGLDSPIATPYTEIDQSRQFSQEIRLASTGAGPLQWVVGGFYSDMHSKWIEQGTNIAYAALSDPGTNPGGILFYSDNPYRIRQFAAFADGSYSITDTLKFSAGLRWFRYMSSVQNNEWGLFATSFTKLGSPPETSAAASGVTPRFDLSYSPDRDLTLYVSASKGFRPGGANMQVPNFCGASPTSYGPDSVWNYEAGEKARLFDDRLTVNGDFYYIQWNGVQQTLLLNCGYQYNDNAGNGRSFGPELEVSAKITPEWSISASGSYTDAEITNPSPTLAASLCANGTSCSIGILNVPKYSGTVALVYTRPIFNGYVLTTRLTDNYTGTSVDESYSYGINLPAYNLVNFRASLSNDAWTADFFINNLTNKRALLSANNTSFQFNIPALVRYSTNQPLTAGVDFTYHF